MLIDIENKKEKVVELYFLKQC